ncbi:MAG: hypothetical protein ACAH80_10100 [Alphaproteobacteria bacterium]
MIRIFKSLFESGTAFSEKIVPKALEKTGVPAKTAAKIGQVSGSLLGLASVATGFCFLAAIPISLPMFVAATGWIGTHAVIASVLATGFLASVGTVVTTTGIGMCRSGFRAVSPLAPPAPEKSSFDAFKTARAMFNQASVGPPVLGFAEGPALSRKSANSSQLRNTASGA